MFISTSLTARAVCESCSIRIAMWNQSRICSECGCKKPGSERTLAPPSDRNVTRWRGSTPCAARTSYNRRRMRGQHLNQRTECRLGGSLLTGTAKPTRTFDRDVTDGCAKLQPVIALQWPGL